MSKKPEIPDWTDWEVVDIQGKDDVISKSDIISLNGSPTLKPENKSDKISPKSQSNSFQILPPLDNNQTKAVSSDKNNIENKDKQQSNSTEQIHNSVKLQKSLVAQLEEEENPKDKTKLKQNEKEKEQKEREQKEREQKEREQKEREQREREQREKEKKEKEKKEKEQKEREQREYREREQREKEQREREQKEQREKEQREKEQREQEQREKENKISSLFDSSYTWVCSVCQHKNDESYRFCPNCGSKNNLMVTTMLDQTSLLKLVSKVNEDKYNPGESKQCGWVLTNCTNDILNLDCHLEFVGGDGFKVSYEKSYTFNNIAPKDNIYVLVDVEAPLIPKSYTSFWQLLLPDNRRVGPLLELPVDVIKQFSDQKEEKITQIIEMGFGNRQQVISALQNNEWNIQQAINQLTEQ